MKIRSKSLLLVALFISTTLPAWAQSTQGMEFWVSSTIACSPGGSGNKAAPYIAISAEDACHIDITGGLDNAIDIHLDVVAGSWNEFGNANKEYNGTTPYYNSNPATGPINIQMDASKWYPVATSGADDVCALAGQKNMYGLHIKATRNISVYVILSSLNSMDASNILPVTALGSEYYTQDYWPNEHQGKFSKLVTMTTILAVEDGTTTVKISPNGTTFDGKSTPYTIDLIKGQTYYLMSEIEKQLSGTHIEALDGRKIAVYTGSPLTDIPVKVSARDCLFEQPMPVDYWGTQFIVTRSLKKNGNLIGITAITDGTSISIDGYEQKVINEGDTYYIMLQNDGDPYAKKPGDKPVDIVITQDAAFIETSCPCAVYSYDTGNSFAGNTGDEIESSKGDPSSVWVSPVQQKINQITFGTCYTTKTRDHFLNVVTATSSCNDTKLFAIFGATELDKSSDLVWNVVEGNPDYSYARVQIGTEQTKNFSVFRLSNPKGVIATVYGNGDDESYAYSAGSAAVKNAVEVNGVPFEDGMYVSAMSEAKFCVEDAVGFDFTNTSPDRYIERVEMDFGDNTDTVFFDVEEPIYHTYTSPTWYDVVIKLVYATGQSRCRVVSSEAEKTIKFSFQLVQADTVVGGARVDTIKAETMERARELAEQGNTHMLDSLNYLLTHDSIVIEQEYCFETAQLFSVHYCMESIKYDTLTPNDSYYEPLNGKTYPLDPNNPDDYHIDLEFNLTELKGITNYTGCDSILKRHVDIRTCLAIEIAPDKHHACFGDEVMPVPYTLRKGMMGPITILFNGDEIDDVELDGDFIPMPVRDLKPGNYSAVIWVEDTVCDVHNKYPIDFSVYYSSSIISYRFNNVLAVLNAQYNGGYEFTDYQWYRNGELIEGANNPVYHTSEPFSLNDEYFAVLTNKDGLTLATCPVLIDDVPPFDKSTNQSNSPARKELLNRQIVIRLGEQMFNVYGQRVK